MADLPPNPDSVDDTDVAPNHGSAPSTPRWVKMFGIIALILVLLVGIIVFTGVGGEHGPGRHIQSSDAVATPSADSGNLTPPIEPGVQQP
jgi:hypothetical protein